MPGKVCKSQHFVDQSSSKRTCPVRCLLLGLGHVSGFSPEVRPSALCSKMQDLESDFSEIFAEISKETNHLHSFRPDRL
jgi:hypothetical protein